MRPGVVEVSTRTRRGDSLPANHPRGTSSDTAATSAPDPGSPNGADLLGALRIDHDRLRLLGERREIWSDAAIATAASLLRGVEERPLLVLASTVRLISEADAVTVVRAIGDPAALVVAAAAGPTNRFVAGDAVPLADAASGSVFRAGQPRLLPEIHVRRRNGTGEDSRGPAMAVPMRSADRVVGAFLVSRSPGRPDFDASDLELLATYVDHATVAIELAEARTGRERGALLEDRARIARDLHDTAIQQLFAAGLELRATAAGLPPGAAADGLLHVVGLVDGAIGQIRTAVLALSPDPDGDSLRHRAFEVLSNLAASFRSPPRLVFDGPVDLIGRGPLTEDVLAVVRESLSNVAKHASAHHVSAAIRVGEGMVEVEVWDDGVGLPDRPRRSGIANLASRAHDRGGTFTITDESPGTCVLWRVPLPVAGAPQ